MILSLLLVASNLVGCGLISEKEPRTIYVAHEIPLRERVKPIDMYDVKFYVVTEQNIDEFIAEFESKNGNVVFVALSIPDYENLSLNMAEIKRYIEQQKSVIIYYENSINQNKQRE